MGSSYFGSSSSLNKQPESFLVGYLRYKAMCEELTEENMALKQDNLNLRRKYDAQCLNVADLEAYNCQLWLVYSKLNAALEDQKKGFDSNMKALQAVMDGMHEKLLESKKELHLSVELKTSSEREMMRIDLENST